LPWYGISDVPSDALYTSTTRKKDANLFFCVVSTSSEELAAAGIHPTPASSTIALARALFAKENRSQLDVRNTHMWDSAPLSEYPLKGLGLCTRTLQVRVHSPTRFYCELDAGSQRTANQARRTLHSGESCTGSQALFLSASLREAIAPWIRLRSAFGSSQPYPTFEIVDPRQWLGVSKVPVAPAPLCYSSQVRHRTCAPP